jgi:protein required for attachment to host cells
MKKTWIVIANASRARVCKREETNGSGLRDLIDFVHIESPQMGAHLDPRIDARQQEHERFAREIAQHLDKGVAAHQCERIVLIASNPFLVEIESQLGPAATAVVWITASSDLTAFSGRELVQRVDDLIAAA